MKKIALLCISVLVLSFPSLASAINFQLTSYTVTAFWAGMDEGGSLRILTNDLLTQPTNFTLDNVVGASFADYLFEIGTDEGTVNTEPPPVGDTTPVSITVEFTFDVGVEILGGTTVGNVATDSGDVVWNDPFSIDFGSGGQFSVDLADVSFGTPGGGQVDFASVEMTVELTRAVPEPSTLLLLGTGLLGIGIFRRKFKV